MNPKKAVVYYNGKIAGFLRKEDDKYFFKYVIESGRLDVFEFFNEKFSINEEYIKIIFNLKLNF